MAKATRTRGPKPAAEKPVEQPKPPTPEELMGQISHLIGQGDEFMSKRTNIVNWDYTGPPLSKISDELQDLIRDLNKVLNPKSMSWDRTDALQMIRDQLTITDPTKITWCRPAMFVLWIGIIPVLCTWGGLGGNRSDHIYAVDPNEPWIHHAGFRSVNFSVIQPDMNSPIDVFSRWLERLCDSVGFELGPLSTAGQTSTRERLEEPAAEWLRDALRAGPRNPLPLPARILSVPQRFAL